MVLHVSREPEEYHSLHLVSHCRAEFLDCVVDYGASLTTHPIPEGDYISYVSYFAAGRQQSYWYIGEGSTYNHPPQSSYWDTSNSPPRTSASRQRYSPDQCSGVEHSAPVRRCIGRRHPGRRLCRIRVWILGCRRGEGRLRCPIPLSLFILAFFLSLFIIGGSISSGIGIWVEEEGRDIPYSPTQSTLSQKSTSHPCSFPARVRWL